MNTQILYELSGLPHVSADVSFTQIQQEAKSELTRVTRVFSPHRFAQLTHAVGEMCRRAGQLSEARLLFQNSLALFESSRDLQGRARSYWGLGSLARQRGNLQLSARMLRLSRQYAAVAGDEGLYLYANAGVAECTRLQGDYRRAVTQHRLLERAFGRFGHVRGVIWARQGEAQIRLNQGALAQASSLFASTLTPATAISDRRAFAWALRGIAEVRLREGNVTEALAGAAAARNIFGSLNMPTGVGFALRTESEAMITAGNLEEAYSLAERANRTFSSCGHESGVAYAKLTLAKASLTAEAAFALANESLHLFKRMNIRLGQGEALKLLQGAGR